MTSVGPQFANFLVEAKRNTYASESPINASVPILESSRQLQCSSGNFLYRDIYFGSERFSGIEVAYEGKVPIWTMVYSGGMLSPTYSAAVYAFLKKALREVSTEFPVRGPKAFKESLFTYENHFNGSGERFHGEEYILSEGVEVYQMNYHGGLIK